MSIEPTQEETTLLRELPESALHEIKAVVHRSETSDFRRSLRDEVDQIRRLLERL